MKQFHNDRLRIMEKQTTEESEGYGNIDDVAKTEGYDETKHGVN